MVMVVAFWKREKSSSVIVGVLPEAWAIVMCSKSVLSCWRFGRVMSMESGSEGGSEGQFNEALTSACEREERGMLEM